MKKDYLVSGIAYGGKLRVIAARSTHLTQEGCRRHQTLPTASAALGRTLTAGILFASNLKGEEKYTIRIAGDGPIGEIVVDANAHGDVRGYLHHGQVHFPANEKGKLDVARAVGQNGMVAVIKSFGTEFKFTGQTPIVSGEIAEDLASYLVNSEQIPSALALGVLVNPDGTIAASGGYLIQALPGCDEATLVKAEEAVKNAKPISTMLSIGMTPETILTQLIGKESLTFLEEKSILFRCTCSKQRTTETLKLLGKTELIDMIEKQKGAEVFCNFCNERYTFNDKDLKKIIAEIDHAQH
jgi:molecular chaperone Hsp33